MRAMAEVECKHQGANSDLRTALWRRFSGNAMPFDGLSALTQLTHFATDYASSMQRQQLCGELAHLTRLRKLDAPVALQSEGEGL